MLGYMSYENYASICSSKKIQSEQHVHVTKAALQRKETHGGKQDAVKIRETEMVNIFTYRTTERMEKRPKKTPSLLLKSSSVPVVVVLA